jgi:hypothetical protein
MFPIAGSRVQKDYVYNIPWNYLRPCRAGIIPYRMIHGTRYFGFGIDRWFNQRTDFGGMVDYDIDSNALKGALREFSEESLGVFGRIPDHLLSRGLAVYDHEMIIIFIDVTELIEGISADELETLFEKKSQRKHQRKHQEIKAISWIPEDYLRWMIDFPDQFIPKPLPRQKNTRVILSENQENHPDKLLLSNSEIYHVVHNLEIYRDFRDLEIYRVVHNFLYRGGNFYEMLL